MSFTEIADRVWVAHQQWFSLNIGLIAGSSGLVVVDTHASGAAARSVIDEIRALGVGDVTAVVNTHEHFDHTFGNGTFRSVYDPALPLYATEAAAARTPGAGRAIVEQYRAAPEDPHRAEVMATEIVPPDHTFSSVAALDLGDRVVELVHPGRGHTAGDLVVNVPDAEVLFAGDLVEESGPPAYGPEDSFPLEWPAALDLVLGLLTPEHTVVPGHGRVVDQAFVGDQHAQVSALAQQIEDLAGRGVPVEDALESGEWPWPRDHVAAAVRRGYGQLRPDQKRLPLA